MTDMPSAVLKVLGISLVLVGLTGTFGGLYALKVVYDYDFSSISPEVVTTSISEISLELETEKQKVETSIDDVSSYLVNASDSVSEAGDKVDEASADVSTASKNMSTAADNLRSASTLNKDAGVYMSFAAQGLEDWADAYEFNGSSLPSKSDFVASVDKLTSAAEKIEASGEKLSNTADNLEDTSRSLNRTSSSLGESSIEFRDVGENLNQTRKNFEGMKEPLGGFISSVSIALKESIENIHALSGITSNLKTIAYLLVGYLIIFHVIVLGVGIALIIIEVNLFYSTRS